MTSPPLNGPEFIDAPMRKSKRTASLKSHDATSSQKCFMARLQAMSCTYWAQVLYAWLARVCLACILFCWPLSLCLYVFCAQVPHQRSD